MASKTPPPDQKLSPEAAKAAALAKQFEVKKAAEPERQKAIFDPKRDPNTYSADELRGMLEAGEIKNPFTEENLFKFLTGQITWAELTGMTMHEAYAFAEVAYNLFEQGKYDQAQQIVEGLVISNPYDGYFHGLLGAIYGRKGMDEEASEEYSIAIELDATNISAFVNRAELRLQHGEIEKALADLKKAVELDPKAEKPFGIRARALAAATAAVLEEALKEKGFNLDELNAGNKKPAVGAGKPAAAKPAGGIKQAPPKSGGGIKKK